MKMATAPQDVNVHGNFKTSDFSIGDIAFIVDMFADKVYSNKERAVIRELSCNAYDSHVIAGTQDIPFNVHLPTSLEPWFSVRDFGTGLSDHDIRTIFAGIGISTKRNSNDVIGCFGIGSLSPYSLTDSFTVVSYHNGMMRTYTCYRDEQRKPVVALLSEQQSSEPNGLEVTVSVNGKISVFEHEAERVFRFWEGTLPNINNKQVVAECESQRKRYIFKTDDFCLSSSYGEMYALMGNIAYKIPYELDQFHCDGYIKFNLGELDFDTARENLSMTDKVREAIKAKFKIIKEKINSIAIEQIESEQTVYAKALVANKLSKLHLASILNKSNFPKYMLPQPKDSFEYWQSKYRGSDKSTGKHVPVGDNVEYYLHKDRMTHRIKNYLKDKQSGYTLVIFKDVAQAVECSIPSELLRNLDDLEKPERTSNGNKTYSTVKTYVWTGYNNKPSNCWSEYSLDIDDETEIVYVELNRFEPCNNLGLNAHHIAGSNHAILTTRKTLQECNVAVPKLIGLKSAFLNTKQFRDGNFVHFSDYVKREFAKIVPDVAYEYSEVQMGTMVEICKCIDHDEAKNIVSKKQSELVETITAVWQTIGGELNKEVKTDNSVQLLMDEFFEKYSMLTLLSNWEITQNKGKVAKYIGGKVK